MVQSTEYPDLRWIPPRAWGSGRDGKAVRYIVIHYTAGAERSTSAEDGAAYDQRRADGTSTHYFVDQNSIVQCVRTQDRANAARHRGNRLGIHYELCGTAQTRAQWLDAASLATLRLAAGQVARDCRKYGIPARRLSVAETRRAWTEYPDGPKGIVGHVDCTAAYPEDGGDHTDPGPEFPWDVFLDLVRDELKEDEMATQFNADDKAELYAAAKKTTDTSPAGGTLGGLKSDVGTGVTNHGIPDSLAPNTPRVPLWTVLAGLMDEVTALKAQVAAQGATLAGIQSGVDALIADPIEDGAAHPIVAAVKYYHETVAPPTS